MFACVREVRNGSTREHGRKSHEKEMAIIAEARRTTVLGVQDSPIRPSDSSDI
jgi:hypothetical protein